MYIHLHEVDVGRIVKDETSKPTAGQPLAKVELQRTIAFT